MRASECQTEHYSKKYCQQIARNMSRTHHVGAQIGAGWCCGVQYPTTACWETAASRAKQFDAHSASKRSAKSDTHSTSYTTAKSKLLVGLVWTEGSNSPHNSSYPMRKECAQNICLWEPRLPFIAPWTYPLYCRPKTMKSWRLQRALYRWCGPY